jgi:hypothetical protein
MGLMQLAGKHLSLQLSFRDLGREATYIDP